MALIVFSAKSISARGQAGPGRPCHDWAALSYRPHFLDLGVGNNSGGIALDRSISDHKKRSGKGGGYCLEWSTDPVGGTPLALPPIPHPSPFITKD